MPFPQDQKQNKYIYSHTFIQQSTENPNHSNRQENEIKEVQIRKEDIKLPLFAGDKILHIESRNSDRLYFLGPQNHCQW